MHLSLLSDCFVSDALDDGGRGVGRDRQSPDSGLLLRGFVVVAVAAFLAGLTLMANFAEPAAADTAPRFDAHASAAAVNLMHREVIGH